MDTSEETKSGGRTITAPRGKRPLYVWVTPEERAEIERLAASAGLAVSVYLRTLGLAYEPKSVLDAERVGDLLKACGDLGRLGRAFEALAGGPSRRGRTGNRCPPTPRPDRRAARADRRKGGGDLIAKVSRRVAGGSFGRLAAYVSDLKKIGDLRDWRRTADYILDRKGGGERVDAIRVTNCANEEPGLALAEIAAIQERNTSSKTDKTYHLIVSFPPARTPDAGPAPRHRGHALRLDRIGGPSTDFRGSQRQGPFSFSRRDQQDSSDDPEGHHPLL